MGLTTGSGPFGDKPAGRFNFTPDPPTGSVLYFDPVPLPPAAFLAGHAAFYWKKLDEWFVEDEQVFGHPRDPYHRIDTYRTSRPVRISVDGETLAESTQAVALFESGLPPRFYLPAEDV